MDENDFLDNIGESNPGERHGLRELPKGTYMVEVLSCEKKKTKDGTGYNMELSVRVCQKPWANRRAWGRFFIQSSDASKQKGAKSGAAMFDEVLTACGFILPKDKSAKSKLAVELGMAEPFDKEKYRSGQQSLVGKFMLADIDVPPKKNPDDENEKVFPKLVRGKMIDPSEYADMLKTVEPRKAKKEEDAGEQPPF